MAFYKDPLPILAKCGHHHYQHNFHCPSHPLFVSQLPIKHFTALDSWNTVFLSIHPIFANTIWWDHQLFCFQIEVFVGQHSIFRDHYIQNVIEMHKNSGMEDKQENVTHLSQSISLKAKKILRKSQAQFRENLTKLRPRQNDTFL